MMTTVGQILRSKPDVYAVSPDDTVYDALTLMAAYLIGAVLVLAAIAGALTVVRDDRPTAAGAERLAADPAVAEVA